MFGRKIRPARALRIAPLLASVLAAACTASTALAQETPPPSQTLRYHYDSGPVANTANSTQVISSATIHVQGAAWLRLLFQHVYLAGDADAGTGAIVRITSFKDGATQELDANDVRRWRASSAYFNGDTVELEIVAPPGVGSSRVAVRALVAGLSTMPLYSICGPTDDRTLSSDAACGRLMPVPCTGWIFDDCAHSLLTAGHCAGTDPVNNLTTIEFNVPPSDPAGQLQHPPPEDQYSIDPNSFQWSNNGVGDDWCYFGCFPNSNTALTPYQAQGQSYALAPAPPAFNAAYTMRVTGYGQDLVINVNNQVQQTATGPYFSFGGSTLRYAVDTTPGASGSPVTWEDGGGVAIGIHTHSGCNPTPPINANWGTGSNNVGMKAAIANPLGICAPSPSVTTYCTAKVNSQGCMPLIGGVGTPTVAGGPGSFAVTASSVLNQKPGLMYYGYLPRAAPFHGGVKCVSAPTTRTPLQASGGTPTGDDCTGAYSYDMGARIASGVDSKLVCGAIVYCQYWSRDPADPTTTGLTAGLRFTIGP